MKSAWASGYPVMKFNPFCDENLFHSVKMLLSNLWWKWDPITAGHVDYWIPTTWPIKSDTCTLHVSGHMASHSSTNHVANHVSKHVASHVSKRVEPCQQPRGRAMSAASMANGVRQPDGTTYCDENRCTSMTKTDRHRMNLILWRWYFRHRMVAHLWRKFTFRHNGQSVTLIPWRNHFRHKFVTDYLLWRFWCLLWRKHNVIDEHIPSSDRLPIWIGTRVVRSSRQ